MTSLERIILETHLYKNDIYLDNFIKWQVIHQPAVNAIDKNDVKKKWFRADDTKIAPPPEVETSHSSKPFLLKNSDKGIQLVDTYIVIFCKKKLKSI